MWRRPRDGSFRERQRQGDAPDSSSQQTRPPEHRRHRRLQPLDALLIRWWKLNAMKVDKDAESEEEETKKRGDGNKNYND